MDATRFRTQQVVLAAACVAAFLIGQSIMFQQGPCSGHLAPDRRRAPPIKTSLEPRPGWKPFAVLACSVLAVSTGAIFARLADAPPLIIATYRVGLAFLILAPFACWKSGHELRGLTRRDVLLGAMSGLFLAAHFGTWITSLEYTSVANSVVLVNTIPLWVGLMAPRVTGEHLGRGLFWSILLSLCGSALICVADLQISRAHFRGDLLAIAGAICAACYLLIGRTLRKRRSLLAYVMLCYGSATVVLGGLVLVKGLPAFNYPRSTIAALVGMAIVSQILGHTAFNWVLRWLRSGFVSVCLLGEPILATLWAYVLLGERLSLIQCVGAGLVLLGIYVAARSERSVDRAAA